MKFRNGLLVAGSLAMFAACGGAGSGARPSAGGGGALPPGTPLPTQSGGSAEAGEREREDQFTRAAQEFLNEGYTAQTQGDEAAAAAAFQEAIAQAEAGAAADPSNPRAQILLGEAAVEAAEYGKAGEAYALALVLRPAYEEETKAFREQQWVRLYNEAIPALQAGEYETALPILAAADRIYGVRPEIKLLLGQVYAQQEQYEEAIEAMEDARSVIESPRIEEVDTATARSWREGAADINPTIAQSLIRLERFGDAVPVLEELIVEYPQEIAYVFSLADAFREIDQTDDAIGLYNEVASRPGLGASDYLQLGLGLYQLDEYPDAAQAFMQAAEVAPYDRDALELGVNSLQLYYVNNDEATATPAEVESWVDMSQRWLELDPHNDDPFIALAQGLARQGDNARAPELLNAAQALPFLVENLQMTRTRTGASVGGVVRRVMEEAPASVSLLFTFYDAAGSVLGTQEETVALPTGEGAVANLNVAFDVEGVEGYGYSVQN